MRTMVTDFEERMEKIMAKLLLVAVVCAFLAVPLRADLVTVNIDFQPSSGTTYSGVGMAADSGTYWNAMGTGAASNLLASDGATVTDIDVSSTYTRTYANTGNALLRDRLIFSPDGPPAINISGLDAGLRYNVYLYAGYYGQRYTIGVESRELTGLDWNANQPSWVEGTHYVSFLGVSPASGTIDIDVFDTGIDTTPFSDSPATVVSGMQIEAVPVPGAVLLGILGLSAVGVKLRKFA